MIATLATFLLGLAAPSASPAAAPPAAIRPCAIAVDIGTGPDRQVVDVGRGLATRWGVGPRPATAHVAFTPAERDTLCAILAGGGVFTLPASFGSGTPGAYPPVPTYTFTLSIGGRTKRFAWHPDVDPKARPGHAGPDPRQDFLFEFRDHLGAMLARQPAYRKLRQMPPAHPVR